MKDTFAFIGAGNMGGAIVKAVCRSAEPSNVYVYDPNSDRAQLLSAETGCELCKSAEDAVQSAEFIFLCVKPGVLRDVLKVLLPMLCEELSRGRKKVLISIAAGVSLATITDVLNEGDVSLPVIRLMPNTPVTVGKGLVLMSGISGVPDRALEAVERALEPGGMVARIDEGLIDAATPVFSCSPAFTYMYIEALADGGVMAGLPREKAQMYAAQSVLGAAAMVLETGRHPGELKDAVCSPGGSTIVGVETLEGHGFRGAVGDAVVKAYEKTSKLGK